MIRSRGLLVAVAMRSVRQGQHVIGVENQVRLLFDCHCTSVMSHLNPFKIKTSDFVT